MTATQRPGRLATLPGRPAPQPRPRPASPLRIVPPGELSPQGRRRRRRLVTVGAAVLLTVGLLGVAVVHAVLAQQQFALSSLQARTAAAQATNEELRLQVAELQSPERIVSAAQQKLGMVPPPSIVYLVPGGHAMAVRAPTAPAAAPTPAPAAGSAAASSRPSSGATSSGPASGATSNTATSGSGGGSPAAGGSGTPPTTP